MEVRGYRVFYVDPEEGVNDLIELIKTTTADRLAMVVHNRLLILNSQVNLKLIKQFAEKYNKDLVFINPDPQIIEKVKQVGFEVFPDLNALESNVPYQVEAAEKEINEEKSKGGYLKKIVNLVLFISIFTLVYFYFFYPTATIELEPVVKEASQEVKISAGFGLNRINWEKRMIPLHKFEVAISDQDEIKTTGIKLVGISKATGVVKFINENNKDINIPAGAVVKTGDGVKFKTLEDVTVPGLKVDYLMDVPVGMKAGQAEVKIEAIEKGSVGNVGIGKIKFMEKAIEKIHVINPEPTRGGRDKRHFVVTEGDINNLQKNLDEKLKSKLLTRIYQKLGGNYRIIDEEIKYSDIKFTFDNKVGQFADVLRGKGTLTASGYLLRNNELDRLATSIFKDNLQNDFQLMSSGVNIEELKLAEAEKGLYNIKLELVAPVIPKIDTNNLVANIKGLKVQDARKILENRSDIEKCILNSESEVIPRLDFAVKVIVKEPDSYQVFSQQ